MGGVVGSDGNAGRLTGGRGRPRAASEAQVAEVLLLHKRRLPMRAIARRVFGDARLKDRVARIVAASPREELEAQPVVDDEEAAWQALSQRLEHD
jgi:hypothetical protein